VQRYENYSIHLNYVSLNPRQTRPKIGLRWKKRRTSPTCKLHDISPNRLDPIAVYKALTVVKAFRRSWELTTESSNVVENNSVRRQSVPEDRKNPVDPDDDDARPMLTSMMTSDQPFDADMAVELRQRWSGDVELVTRRTHTNWSALRERRGRLVQPLNPCWARPSSIDSVLIRSRCGHRPGSALARRPVWHALRILTYYLIVWPYCVQNIIKIGRWMLKI